MAADRRPACSLRPHTAHYRGERAVGRACAIHAAARGTGSYSPSGAEVEATQHIPVGKRAAHGRARGRERSWYDVGRNLSVVYGIARHECRVLFCMWQESAGRPTGAGDCLPSVLGDQSCVWSILCRVRRTAPQDLSMREPARAHPWSPLGIRSAAVQPLETRLAVIERTATVSILSPGVALS